MKKKSIIWCIVFAELLFMSAQEAFSATYYVDFGSGIDSQAGTSAAQSWKHCPGDTNATGVASNTALAAGDAVIFKGGVRYRGTINCNWSGTPAARIVYDGNTAGTFGTGRAIIDGSEHFANGWTACSSAADCGGNTNWSHIYKTFVPTNTDIFLLNMYEGDNTLWPAQNPNVTDPFYLDDVTTYTPIWCAQVTRTSVTDTNAFIQTNADYYAGCYLRLWGSPNRVRDLAITNYIPAAHTIQFPDTGEDSLYTNKTVYYAVANNLSHLDVPGEFSVVGTNMYLWPKTGNPNTNEVSQSIRRQGIFLKGKSCVDIQGFRIEKHTSADEEYSSGCAIVDRLGGSNNRILNNEITKNYSFERCSALKIGGTASAICTNILIDGNYVYENPNNRGMLVTANDSTIQNNTLRKNGGTALDLFGAHRSFVLGNTVRDNVGSHGNGISIYEGCADCVVAYNKVFDGLIALTLGDATNIVIAYNILHTADDGVTTITWSGADRTSDGIYYYNNVILNQNASALGYSPIGTTHLEVRNNILDGCGIPAGSNLSYNLYTKLNWSQAAKYGWSLGEGEIIQTNRSLVFADFTNRDFHLISGSPAIDAGTNVDLTVDIEGQPVPSGTAPDIGAYEYGSGLHLLFDFGGTNYLTSGNWNNVNTTRVSQVNQLILTNAVDINGLHRGINLRLTQQASTLYLSTGVNASNIYPASAQRDNIYGYVPVSYRFEGVVPSAGYKLTFFASTTKSTTNRETLYTVGASNVVLDAAYNTNRTAVIAGAQADTNGYLTFTVNTNTVRSAAWYLSVLELERTQ